MSVHARVKQAWDEQLALIEFSYNNSYHSSIGIGPYEALCMVRDAKPCGVGWR